MPNCTQILELLPQFVSDGHLDSSPDAGLGEARVSEAVLREHLRTCRECQLAANVFVRVEGALRTIPDRNPDPRLEARIMSYVASRRFRERWDALPWSVWVPGLAMVVAIVMALLSIPPQALPVDAASPVGAAVPSLRMWVAEWVAAAQLDMGGQSFWAVWTGVFLALGGIGLAVGLRAWSDLHSRSLEGLEHRVFDAAQRTFGNLRRAG